MVKRNLPVARYVHFAFVMRLPRFGSFVVSRWFLPVAQALAISVGRHKFEVVPVSSQSALVFSFLFSWYVAFSIQFFTLKQ